jgi:hypothetical protein
MERRSRDVILGTIRPFVRRNWWKPRKASVIKKGLSPVIWTRRLQTKKLECWSLRREVPSKWMKNRTNQERNKYFMWSLWTGLTWLTIKTLTTPQRTHCISQAARMTAFLLCNWLKDFFKVNSLSAVIKLHEFLNSLGLYLFFHRTQKNICNLTYRIKASRKEQSDESSA